MIWVIQQKSKMSTGQLTTGTRDEYTRLLHEALLRDPQPVICFSCFMKLSETSSNFWNYQHCFFNPGARHSQSATTSEMLISRPASCSHDRANPDSLARHPSRMMQSKGDAFVCAAVSPSKLDVRLITIHFFDAHRFASKFCFFFVFEVVRLMIWTCLLLLWHSVLMQFADAPSCDAAQCSNNGQCFHQMQASVPHHQDLRNRFQLGNLEKQNEILLDLIKMEHFCNTAISWVCVMVVLKKYWPDMICYSFAIQAFVLFITISCWVQVFLELLAFAKLGILARLRKSSSHRSIVLNWFAKQCLHKTNYPIGLSIKSSRYLADSIICIVVDSAQHMDCVCIIKCFHSCIFYQHSHVQQSFICSSHQILKDNIERDPSNPRAALFLRNTPFNSLCKLSAHIVDQLATSSDPLQAIEVSESAVQHWIAILLREMKYEDGLRKIQPDHCKCTICEKFRRYVCVWDISSFEIVSFRETRMCFG